MALTRINNNVSALNATRNLNTTGQRLMVSLERLSSGLRINRAADDAAGLSISEQQRSQIRGLRRAISNAQDAISLVNTAEGALTETTNRLQRIRELAVQAANSGGQDANAIQAAQDEIETAIQEITRIGNNTQFSTRILLNGDNQSTASVREGTPSRGVAVSQTSVASSIPNGTSFLRITQTQVGTEYISAGTDGVGNFLLASGDAITGSTFQTGQYAITVSNVTQAAQQAIRTGQFLMAGVGADIDGGTSLLSGISFAGVELGAGDVLTLRATLNDGTQTSASVTLTAGVTFTSFVASISALFTGEASAAYQPVLTTASSSALLEITSTLTGESRLGLEILVDDASATGGTPDGVGDGIDTAAITTVGADNSAVLTVANGPAVTARAGETVTLYGIEPPTPNVQDFQRQVTLQFAASGAFLREGVEMLNVVENRYSGSLNNGRAVDFVAGQKEVLFRTGTAAGFNSGDFLLLDFDTAIDLSGTPAVGLEATVIISGTNNGLNFHIGANEGQNLLIGLSDMRAFKLGFLDGLVVNGEIFEGTVDQIDVRTVTGAENALRIVDRALAQVSRQRSFLGATTNRLEATVANLGVAVENLTAAESRIRDADIAYETTQFTRDQILLQAGTAILAQANLAPQVVLQLLG